MELYRQLQPKDPILTDGRDRAVFLEILRCPRLSLFVLVGGGQIRSTCDLNVITGSKRESTRAFYRL